MTLQIKKNALGFTLLELMIVIAIIAILASIAYPSYQDSVRKARRGDAQAALVEASSFMERYFTENNTYVGAAWPADIVSDFYALTVAVPSQLAFVLQAAPQNDQVNDDCKTMTLNQVGAKATTGTAGCW